MNAALIFILYLVAVNLLAVALTVYDKKAAGRVGQRRIREQTLLMISVIGGSVAMLLTMRYIRHKTKHAIFMAGIPVIIVLQVAAVLYIWWKLKTIGL